MSEQTALAYATGSSTPIPSMIKVIGISLAVIAAFTYITYLTFKKSEIK